MSNLFKYKPRDIDSEMTRLELSTRELETMSRAMNALIKLTGDKIDEVWKDSQDGSYGFACNYELNPLKELKQVFDVHIEANRRNFYENPENLND
ncbi:MAG: hypothetical protein V2I33_08525 [Kangiellaceae bacterium]|jgi:hypothetical protein|nr:hypothetical protein [Kangiellaceae bacterium]